jgi:serine/threonine protein kinase
MDQIVSILVGISAGMMHLHMEKISHRDLAARNILIDQVTLKPKICDFGLSRLQQADTSYTNSNIGPIKVWKIITNWK